MALITLIEVVLGPLLVWISVGETPALATLVGGAVVVVAVLIQTTERTQRQETFSREPAPEGAA